MDDGREIHLAGGGALALLLALIAPLIGTAYGECSAFDGSMIANVWTTETYPAWAERQIAWTAQEGALHAAIVLKHAPSQEFLGDANLSRSIAGPAAVTFAWRMDHLPPKEASFENSTGIDGLFLLIDGRIEKACTSTEWDEEGVELGDGWHNLTWMLSKDRGGWNASGWIDRICIDCLIVAPDRVMAGVPSHALVADAGADAVYTWTIAGGEIISGQGTPSITWAARDGGAARVSVEVAASGIDAECEKEILVFGCSIQAPGWVVSDSVYNASVADAGDDAVYNWTIAGGEIISGQGRPSIVWTARDVVAARISVDVAAPGIDAECEKEIMVYECSIQTLGWVVSGGDYNATAPDAGPEARYKWTVSGGRIISGQGTRSIEWRAGSGGPAMIGLVVSVDGIEAGAEKESEVYSCDMNCPNQVFSGESYSASVDGAGPGASYKWTISGGRIISGQGTREIEWRCGGGWRDTSIGVIVSRDGMETRSHERWSAFGLFS